MFLPIPGVLFKGDPGAKKDPVPLSRRVGRNNLKRLHSFLQETQPAVYLAQALLSVDVVGVLRAIAQGCRHGNLMGHKRALVFPQLMVLEPEAFVSLGRDVVTPAPLRLLFGCHLPTIAPRPGRVKEDSHAKDAPSRNELVIVQP